MPYVDWLPKDGGFRHIFHRWPKLARPLTEYSERVMRGPAPFTPAERELLATVTCAVNACEYCYGAHLATAEAMGMDGALIEAVLEDPETADIAPALLPVLAFITKLTRTPARIVKADVDAIFAAGWDEEAFHCCVSVCALFNHQNRILDAYGIKREPGYYTEIGQRIAENGYLGLVNQYIAGDLD